MPTTEHTIYQLVLAGTGPNNNYFANVLHYRVTEDDPTIPFATAGRLIDAWIAALQTLYAALLADDTVIHTYSCKRIGPTGGNTAIKGVGVIGTATGATLANGVGADIAFIADTSTLKSVGHIFTPALTADMIVGGQYQAGFESDVNDFGTALLTTLDFDPNSAEFVLFHKKTGHDDFVTDFALRPKPVLLNKRLRPVV